AGSWEHKVMPETPASQTTLIEPQDDLIVARVQYSDLDENHIKSLRSELDDASQIHKKPFVVDLARVKFIPSLPLSVLVRIANEFRARGQRLILAGMVPGVRQMLAITQLNRLFETQDSVESAIRQIRV